jgi:sirohydrochlorin cobaltochelatase
LKEGIVLFAHGSREPEWARPFERIARELAKKLSACEVRLAYLEVMRPSLEEALADLVAQEVRKIRVVPVFLGLGGHLKEDLPRLVKAAGDQYPGLQLSVEKPIGEQPQVIEAIAAAVAKART